MKPIKYRAWDHHGAKMWHVRMIDFDQETVWLAPEPHSEDHAYPRCMKDVELMPYIGVEDDEGTEICQSDILAIDFGGGPEHRVVSYYGNNSYPAFDAENDFLPVTNVIAMAKTHGLPCRIIGNIYENPDMREVRT